MRIDYVVPLSEHVIMANELVFDVAKGIGPFATDFVDLIENACDDIGPNV